MFKMFISGLGISDRLLSPRLAFATNNLTWGHLSWISVFNLTMTGGDRLVLQCFAVVYYTKAKPVTPQFPITHCSETIPNWLSTSRLERSQTPYVATASLSHVYHVQFFVHGDFAGVQWLRVVNLRTAFFFLLFFQFQSSVSLGEVCGSCRWQVIHILLLTNNNDNLIIIIFIQ